MSGRQTRGHLPFAVWNRSGNRMVSWVLRSPFHRPLSGRLALITVTGTRTGRAYTIPVGYRRDGANVTIPVMWPDRKTWWRNVRQGAPVTLRIGGETRCGLAIVRDPSAKQLTVEVTLDAGAD